MHAHYSRKNRYLLSFYEFPRGRESSLRTVVPAKPALDSDRGTGIQYKMPHSLENSALDFPPLRSRGGLRGGIFMLRCTAAGGMIIPVETGIQYPMPHSRENGNPVQNASFLRK